MKKHGFHNVPAPFVEKLYNDKFCNLVFLCNQNFQFYQMME